MAPQVKKIKISVSAGQIQMPRTGGDADGNSGTQTWAGTEVLQQRSAGSHKEASILSDS